VHLTTPLSDKRLKTFFMTNWVLTKIGHWTWFWHFDAKNLHFFQTMFVSPQNKLWKKNRRETFFCIWNKIPPIFLNRVEFLPIEPPLEQTGKKLRFFEFFATHKCSNRAFFNVAISFFSISIVLVCKYIF
jgi:hypothetical protein